MQLSIRIPLYDPKKLSLQSWAPDGGLSDTWEMWDSIRTICAYHPRLSLSIKSDLWCLLSLDLSDISLGSYPTVSP